MNRRQAIKSIFGGTIGATSLLSNNNQIVASEIESTRNSATHFTADWKHLPDMTWIGEEFWAQRLQDWSISNGQLECLIHGLDRTVHLLTYQLSDKPKSFSASLNFRFLNEFVSNKEEFAGFRMGIKGRYEDYRSAIMTGKGIDAGVTRSGYLFIGKSFSEKKITDKILLEDIQLKLSVSSLSEAHLQAFDKEGKNLAYVKSNEFDAIVWSGNIALISHFKPNQNGNQPTISVSKFHIEGEKLAYHPNQVYGGIYFAQYTVQNSLLKHTAQIAPIDLTGTEAILWIKNGKNWKKVSVSKIHPLARTANFRIEKWNSKKSTPYRVTLQFPLKDGSIKDFSYEGVIAAEPLKKVKLKALAFSCNWDYGFPDNEVVINAGKHNADMVFFLGDQFYEPNGGFGVQLNPLEKATLDYLRKWYQFGWSYRELFRNVPMIALLDDHDVFHGNIWGSGGRATLPKGGSAERQDSGGYKMPAEWVNMAQLTQTSQMPDPFDAHPVGQNIGVYYTTWKYAGISFAVIEDRKFKSAPKDILPSEAKVFNGYAQNPGFDKSKIKELEAQLLGERQILFLKNWLAQKDEPFKVLVSATPFCCLQTLPNGSTSDDITPDLPIPEKGEIITGDAVTQDMDSNGFPHNRRDEIVKLLGKNISLHLVGDQHLPSVVQYGADNFADGAFCFAVPALSNLWPRRWHPPVEKKHQSLPDKPHFTGNFEDGFGNKMTVYAAVSPHKTGKEPANLYDRSTGYGVLEFDKDSNLITLNCYPRYVDPQESPAEQYEGFPLYINNLRKEKN